MDFIDKKNDDPRQRDVNIAADREKLDAALSELFSDIDSLNKQKIYAEGRCKELESNLEAAENDLKKAKDSVPAHKLLNEWAAPLASLFNLAYGDKESVSRKDLESIVNELHDMAKNVDVSFIYHRPGSKYDKEKDGDKVEFLGTGEAYICSTVGFEIGKERLVKENIKPVSKSSANATTGASKQQNLQDLSIQSVTAQGTARTAQNEQNAVTKGVSRNTIVPQRLCYLEQGRDFVFGLDEQRRHCCIIASTAKFKLVDILKWEGMSPHYAQLFADYIIGKKLVLRDWYPIPEGKLYAIWLDGNNGILMMSYHIEEPNFTLDNELKLGSYH